MLTLANQWRRVFWFVLLGMALPAWADDQSNGCGPGWFVTKNYSFSATTTRQTTNSYITPWAMTTGTSGCKKHTLALNQKGLEFIEVNREELALEAARGHGEYLSTLALTFNCDSRVHLAFAQAMRSHYSEIFDDLSSPESVLTATSQIIGQDFILRNSCAGV